MIYEPITLIGQTIAGMLRYDDGVRLEIHEYLREIEPNLKKVFEKAELWDKYIETSTLQDLIVITNKLEVIKKIVDEWGEQRGDAHGLEYDWYYKDKYYALRDALEGSYFTTKGEDSG